MSTRTSMNEIEDESVPSEFENESTSISSKRPRQQRSNVWKEFQLVIVKNDNGENEQKARCIHCNSYYGSGSSHGTSHLKRHLATCVDRSILNTQSELNWKFNQEISRKELARMIILHELPFSIVDHDGFKRFVKSLNPRFKLISRNTIKSDCMEIFEVEKKNLKEVFKTSCERVSLTADMWTSNQQLSYLVITAHFIDNDWKLQKRVLNFYMVESPHPAVTVVGFILKSLREWDIFSKVISITLDNATVNDSICRYLRANFEKENALIFKGKLLHVRCGAHILNIIVQDGLNEIGDIVHNVRESVKYVKSSPARTQRFQEVVEHVGLSKEKGLSLDVSTRWNSTYLMLASAIGLQKAFSSLELLDPNFKIAPSSEDWEKAEIVHKFLKIFYNATNVVSGTKYPTANLYFHEMLNVKLLLEKESCSPHAFISLMTSRMVKKFNKYWDGCLLFLTIPVVLDPRFKLKYFDYCFTRVYGEEGCLYVQRLDDAIHELFDEYKVQYNVLQMEQSPSVDVEWERDLETPRDDIDVLEGWDHYINTQGTNQVRMELDKYLEESVLPRNQQDFDILKWWMINKSVYPTLSRMAHHVLAFPTSTVASESAFSGGGRVLSQFRSSLSCETVEALICAQDWLRNTIEDLSSLGTVNEVEVDISSLHV